MKPNTYQQHALQTGDNMRLNAYQGGARSTAIYPGQITYPTLGLCGETGELADACSTNRKKDVPGEIGDVLWYVANLASDCGFTLEDICRKKTFRSKKPEYDGWDWNDRCTELCIQVGVVAENVKKIIRDHDGQLTPKRKDNIRRALKKIVKCLVDIAYDASTTLEKCAKENLKKLRSRQERDALKGDGDDR